jgi:hypothetical protein
VQCAGESVDNDLGGDVAARRFRSRASTAALPGTLPSWRVMFNRPEAAPASWGLTLAIATMDRGTKMQLSPPPVIRMPDTNAQRELPTPAAVSSSASPSATGERRISGSRAWRFRVCTGFFDRAGSASSSR